ncbi:unnamed protein product, partial [Ilex paraguariensis]
MLQNVRFNDEDEPEKMLGDSDAGGDDVDDLVVKVSISEDETKSFEDLQDAYNELYKECLKQGKKLLCLSMRLKTREEVKKSLHMDLFKSEAHIVGLEEKKSLHDK